MDNYNYDLIILGTLIGFFTLAAILLVPVYRFLKREEKVSEQWTEEALRSIRENEESGT